MPTPCTCGATRQNVVHRRFSCSRSPFARTDAVDEWLQVALAVSIEIFLGGESPSILLQSRKAQLSQRIDQGMMRRAPVAVHILRIDDWMRSFAVPTKAGETHAGQGGLDSP